MGLFSGSFGKGLVTGLATSVDKSLRDALDKRDQEMSSARKFWQTRQAQKLDLKEAEDRRAEKALNRLIKEANGNVALGFAAYQAAGGDVDSVETFLTKYDATKSAKGTFSLSDALVLPEGFDASKMNLTREQALGAVRTPMTGVRAESIDVDDPLSNIGLGVKGGAAQKVADKINGMIPPQEVTTVEGYEGVQLDMTKMLEAEKYAQDQILFEKAKGAKDFQEKAFMISEEISKLNIKDFETEEEYNGQRAKLNKDLSDVYSSISLLARAEETADSGLSASILRVSWSDAKTNGRLTSGIMGSTKDGTASYIAADGNTVYAAESAEAMKGYIAAVQAADRKSAELWVTTNQGEDGAFSSNTLDIVNTDSNLKAAYKSLTDETVEESSGEQAPDALKATDYTIAANVQADPGGFADSVFAAKPNVKPEDLYNTLIRSNVSPEKAAEEAERIHKIQQDKAAAAANTPKYVPGQGLVTAPAKTETPVGDDGYKTAGEVKWRPTRPDDMMLILKNKEIPETVRMEVLEDYVALMVERGKTGQAERVQKEFGIER